MDESMTIGELANAAIEGPFTVDGLIVEYGGGIEFP